MIRYTVRALRDLEESWMPDEYREALQVATEMIARFQNLGHPIGPRGLRCKLHEQHKIYYRLDVLDLVIVRVLHEKRRVPKRLE